MEALVRTVTEEFREIFRLAMITYQRSLELATLEYERAIDHAVHSLSDNLTSTSELRIKANRELRAKTIRDMIVDCNNDVKLARETFADLCSHMDLSTNDFSCPDSSEK